MSNLGRGVNSGPGGDIFPLSGINATGGWLLVTGTTVGAGQTAHTGDSKAYDLPYVTVSNVGSTAVTLYANLGGSTATTGQRQFALSAGQFTTAFSGDVMISSTGTLVFWGATAVYVTGYVARMFTAST